MLDKLQLINQELDLIEVRAASVMHMANVRALLGQVLQEAEKENDNDREHTACNS